MAPPPGAGALDFQGIDFVTFAETPVDDPDAESARSEPPAEYNSPFAGRESWYG